MCTPVEKMCIAKTQMLGYFWASVGHKVTWKALGVETINSKAPEESQKRIGGEQKSVVVT